MSIERAILMRRARSSMGSRGHSSMGAEDKVIAYAKQLDAAVDQHDAQVKRDLCNGESFCGGKVGPHKSNLTYLNTWNNWLQDWRSFYRDHVINTFPDVEQTTLDSWRGQLDDFVSRFRATGAAVTAPALPAAPVTPAGIPWTGLLVIGGIIAAVMVLREIKPERQAVLAKVAA